MGEWHSSWTAEDAGHCLALLVDKPFHCCKGIGNNILADRSGGSHFSKSVVREDPTVCQTNEPSLCDCIKSRVRILSNNSDRLLVFVGLRQGCPLSPVLSVAFMGKISQRSGEEENVRWPPLFTGGHDCETEGIRVSAAKSEAAVLCRKLVDCALRVGTDYLPQAMEYYGVLFQSKSWIDLEIDMRIRCKTGTAPDQRRELRQRAKL